MAAGRLLNASNSCLYKIKYAMRKELDNNIQCFFVWLASTSLCHSVAQYSGSYHSSDSRHVASSGIAGSGGNGGSGIPALS